MTDDQNLQQGTGIQELVFDIKITNGAAKKLDALMKYFDYGTAKEVVGLSLELLDAAKEGEEIVVKKRDGTAKQLIITHKANATKESDGNT